MSGLNRRIEKLEAEVFAPAAHDASIVAAADWIEAHASSEERAALERVFESELDGESDMQPGDAELVDGMLRRMPPELWPGDGRAEK